MHHSFEAAIIANDLDSMGLRIESLPASVHYTNAQRLISEAKAEIHKGRDELSKTGIVEHYHWPSIGG